MADIILPQIGQLPAISGSGLPALPGASPPLSTGGAGQPGTLAASYPLLPTQLLPTFPIINPAPYTTTGDQTVTASPCPLYSAYDYYQLVQFQNIAQQAGYAPAVNQSGLFSGIQSGGFLDMGWIPLEPTDEFRFRAYSSTATPQVSFFGRTLIAGNTIQPWVYNLTPDGNGTVASTIQQAGPGWLLGAAASVQPNSFTFGNVYGIGEIGRSQGGAFVPHTLLFSGQLDGFSPLTTVNPPTNVPLSRTDNFIFNDVGGSTVTYAHTITPSTGKRMRFTRIACLYTCSATTGTRFPFLALRSNGNSFYQSRSLLTRTAGQTESMDFDAEGPQGTTSNLWLASLPTAMYFYQPISVEIGDSSAISASDTVTSVFIRWEES